MSQEWCNWAEDVIYEEVSTKNRNWMSPRRTIWFPLCCIEHRNISQLNQVTYCVGTRSPAPTVQKGRFNCQQEQFIIDKTPLNCACQPESVLCKRLARVSLRSHSARSASSQLEPFSWKFLLQDLSASPDVLISCLISLNLCWFDIYV